MSEQIDLIEKRARDREAQDLKKRQKRKAEKLQRLIGRVAGCVYSEVHQVLHYEKAGLDKADCLLILDGIMRHAEAILHTPYPGAATVAAEHETDSQWS